jgi:hypothetical protein
MGIKARTWLLALLTGVLLSSLAPAAASAAFEIQSFFAANCKEAFEGCHKETGTKEELEQKSREQGYAQAAGHPPFGVTDFTVKSKEVAPGQFVPEGIVKHIRTDVAPGVSTDPFAVAQCTLAEFEGAEAAEGLFTEPACNKEEASKDDTVLGENKAVVALFNEKFEFVTDLPLSGTVYNIVPEEGLASEFAVALEVPKAVTKAPIPLFAHTFIKGNVEWAKEAAGTGQADYHDYFEIDVSPKLPLISSRLVFKGMLNKLKKGAFLTNGSSCPGHHTSTLTLEDTNNEVAREEYETATGTEGCEGEGEFEEVPFSPGLRISQSTKAADTPDALTTEVTVPHSEKFEEEEEGEQEPDSSEVKDVTIALPPGLTLNSAAAAGLEKCTPEQVGLEPEPEAGKQPKALTREPACPEGSKLGTATIETPNLPAGSLQGSVYLGGPANEPITGLPKPFVLYLVAASKRYGVTVRAEGKTTPNPETGQLTTTFLGDPEQPFSNVILHFNGGPFAPLANEVACEKGEASAVLRPYTLTEDQKASSPFEIAGCAESIPFKLEQSTENEATTAGGKTAYTFNLTRKSGEQYIGKIKSVLPAGLIGAIPTVTPCTEPAAGLGTCGAASRIGTATVTAGAGGLPATFKGPVYFTGPYKGAPYGLSIAVPAAAGPFNLGTVVARVTINVDPITGRVTVEDDAVPHIFKGVPMRIRSLSIAVNKQGYLFNPTNCQLEQTETKLTSLGGTVQEGLNSPFQLTGCEGLAFKPSFKAATTGKFSKQNGASLTTTLAQSAGQANIKSVKVQLPIQLPSRTSTLNQACVAATFEANPASCPKLATVGTAEVSTPTLPDVMKGTAILVSHGGAAFPDLDLVVEADGIKIVLVGNTDIKNNITTSTFASTPDAPINSVKVSLPTGPDSLLGANGDLCRRPLVMPTTITGQNGKVTKQNTIISVSGCGVKVIGHKIVGHTAFLTVKTFAAGRITASGAGVSRVSRSLSKAANTASLKVPLSSSGRGKRKPFKAKIKVSFTPKSGKGARSSSTVSVTFR